MIRGRAARLIGAGLVDSFGLSLGWTIFNLQAVEREGLAVVGGYNAALLVGIALSAPFTGWLSSRVGGRGLLQLTACVEAALRIGAFGLLVSGAPMHAVAPLVALMGMMAWTGYAGMRSEIAQVDERAASLARYVAAVAAVEALGAATAALLPGSSASLPVWPVMAIYGGVLIPTFLVAFGSKRAPTPVGRRRALKASRPRALTGSFAVMLLASGPTTIAVGLATELHGRSAVIPSVIAFLLGSVVGPTCAGLLERRGASIAARGAVLGALMVVLWPLAPLGVLGLVLAQFASGASLTAFEGTMDAHLARDDRRVTSALAWAASSRALGSAVAVTVGPGLFATFGLSSVTALAAVALAGVTVLVVVRRQLESEARERAAARARLPAAPGIPSTARQ